MGSWQYFGALIVFVIVVAKWSEELTDCCKSSHSINKKRLVSVESALKDLKRQNEDILRWIRYLVVV